MTGNLRIKAWATGWKYGVGVYEIHDENGHFQGLVPVQKLKEMGFVRRIDHSKKAEEFLNTNNGREWFLQNRAFN